MAKSWDWNAIGQKWAQQMGSASAQANYKAGVQAQTVSPTSLAATPDAEARYIAGIQNSVSSGRRAAKLQAVTLGQWQQAAMTKGAPRLGTGAAASLPKYQAAMQGYSAVYAQIQSQLAGMPKGGLSNAVARAQVAITALMQHAGHA